MDFTTWRHAFKLDPAKPVTDDQLELLAESGTDGIIVGGSDGVTLDNVLDLLVRIRSTPFQSHLKCQQSNLSHQDLIIISSRLS